MQSQNMIFRSVCLLVQVLISTQIGAFVWGIIAVLVYLAQCPEPTGVWRHTSNCSAYPGWANVNRVSTAANTALILLFFEYTTLTHTALVDAQKHHHWPKILTSGFAHRCATSRTYRSEEGDVILAVLTSTLVSHPETVQTRSAQKCGTHRQKCKLRYPCVASLSNYILSREFNPTLMHKTIL